MRGNQWKLVLCNHRGVYTNTYRTKQEVDPQYAADVTMNKFTVTVPSGEICVVNLDSVNFAEAALDAEAILRKGGFFDEQHRNRGIRYYGHYLTEDDVAGQFRKKIDFAAPAEVQKAKRPRGACA